MIFITFYWKLDLYFCSVFSGAKASEEKVLTGNKK